MAPGLHGRQKQTQNVETQAFPMMDLDDIVTILHELGVHASAQDLYKPTASTVQYLWLQILENLTGASMDMLEEPKYALLEGLDYQDAYLDSMSLLILYRNCRTLVLKCNVKTFTFFDLTRPDPLRLRNILSGVLNFAKYRDENNTLPNALQDQAREVRDRALKLQHKLDQIDADIKDIEAKNAEDLPKTERQREINEKLHSELVGMHAEHRKIVEQTEDLKAQRTSLGEDIAMEDRELNQLSQQIKDAKARIVRSPDRIRRHISDMSHHVANERQQHTALVAKSRELAKRLEVYGSLEAELRSLVELEREIETQRTLVDEATKKRTALQSNVEHARIEGESQGERIKQLDRQIKNAEDRVARQKTIIRDSRAEAEAKIQALKNEYVEKSKDRQAQGKLKERIVQEQRAIEAERTAFLQESDETLNELLTQYWQLRKEAEDYMKTLNVQLGLEAYGFYL